MRRKKWLWLHDAVRAGSGRLADVDGVNDGRQHQQLRR
jgi:hypothetical protein